MYENIHTEERQAWFPDGDAEKPLPAGWIKVESRSYPGEFVYENQHTLERQAWRPDAEAPKVENQVQAPPAAAASACSLLPRAPLSRPNSFGALRRESSSHPNPITPPQLAPPFITCANLAR